MEFPEAEVVTTGVNTARPRPQKRSGGFSSFLKNLLVFFLLVGVVVGSFMISFQLGKNILIPVKNEPKAAAPVAVVKPEVSQAAMDKLQAVMDAEIAKAKKGTEKLPKANDEIRINKPMIQASKPAVKPKKEVKVVQAKSEPKQYYKVQAAVVGDKTTAVSLAKKLMSDGFQTYIRQIDQGWRVQAGAYVKRAQAQTMQGELKAKGYESTIVFE